MYTFLYLKASYKNEGLLHTYSTILFRSCEAKKNIFSKKVLKKMHCLQEKCRGGTYQ